MFDNMECERLQRLVKRWYLQVQAEEMGPARMVDFMNNHVSDCMACMADPGVDFELKRITEIVLPQDKIPKAVRKEAKTPDKPADEESVADSSDNSDGDGDGDGDIESAGDGDIESAGNDDLDDTDEGIVDADDELPDAEM